MGRSLWKCRLNDTKDILIWWNGCSHRWAYIFPAVEHHGVPNQADAVYKAVVQCGKTDEGRFKRKTKSLRARSFLSLSDSSDSNDTIYCGDIKVLWVPYFCVLCVYCYVNHMGPFLSMLLLNKADGAGGSGSKSLCSPHKALQWNSMGGEIVTQTHTPRYIQTVNTNTWLSIYFSFFPTITSSQTMLCKHHLNGLNCHWHTYLHYHCTSTHMQTYILLIFLPSCCCVVRQAGRPTQKCQRGGELGKGGLINGAPLSTAMPLRKALWLHIALPPNEAQLLEENDSFALELQGIIA